MNNQKSEAYTLSIFSMRWKYMSRIFHIYQLIICFCFLLWKLESVTIHKNLVNFTIDLLMKIIATTIQPPRTSSTGLTALKILGSNGSTEKHQSLFWVLDFVKYIRILDIFDQEPTKVVRLFGGVLWFLFYFFLFSYFPHIWHCSALTVFSTWIFI